MKKHSATRSAFINPRALVGFVLLFLGVLLALFAFGATPHLPNSKAQEANSSGWFGRFVSAFGVHLESQKFAALPAPRGGGGGAPLSKFPGEPAQGTSQNQTATNYTGPRNDFRPMKAVHTRTVNIRNRSGLRRRLKARAPLPSFKSFQVQYSRRPHQA